jgi:hypothetical protein
MGTTGDRPLRDRGRRWELNILREDDVAPVADISANTLPRPNRGVRRQRANREYRRRAVYGQRLLRPSDLECHIGSRNDPPNLYVRSAPGQTLSNCRW